MTENDTSWFKKRLYIRKRLDFEECVNSFTNSRRFRNSFNYHKMRAKMTKDFQSTWCVNSFDGEKLPNCHKDKPPLLMKSSNIQEPQSNLSPILHNPSTNNQIYPTLQGSPILHESMSVNNSNIAAISSPLKSHGNLSPILHFPSRSKQICFIEKSPILHNSLKNRSISHLSSPVSFNSSITRSPKMMDQSPNLSDSSANLRLCLSPVLTSKNLISSSPVIHVSKKRKKKIENAEDDICEENLLSNETKNTKYIENQSEEIELPSSPIISQRSSSSLINDHRISCSVGKSNSEEERILKHSNEVPIFKSSDRISESSPALEALEKLNTPEKIEAEVLDDVDSGKKRKRFKKDSFSFRLQRLLGRQRSEKRILLHEKNTCKVSNGKDVVYTVKSSWDIGPNKILVSCLHVDNEGSCKVNVIIDKSSTVNVNHLREGSSIHLSPPWQVLKLSGSAMMYLTVGAVKVSLSSDKRDNIMQTQYTSVPKNNFICDEFYVAKSIFN